MAKHPVQVKKGASPAPKKKPATKLPKGIKNTGRPKRTTGGATR